MVHLEDPGGEEHFSRESGHLHDHERVALGRFRCPQCEVPLDLVETDARTPDGDDCELVARCPSCAVTFTREDWRASQRAA